MAFDKDTRNRLAKFVADARGVIADEFTEQFQSLYGISAQGDIAPLAKLSHLAEAGLATAALLRERITYLEKTHPDDKDGKKAAVARLAREQAFTILNRLAAVRMAEKRGLIVETVGQGYQSKGFKIFQTVAGSALGDTYHRYCRFLFCLFDELALDLGVLFDRRSPQALLVPREPALLALLDLLHAADLEPLWAEDETIGWIYQYYNDPEERKKMRKQSATPRNSRELAVRNQFFTPRYVVEFLTDNTLGRIWYEMTKGKTRLAEQCRYLVRRPTEIFLNEGEVPPRESENRKSEIESRLSQEEILRQPVNIPHRPLKDPRELRLLDPACGSMHFGLYAFDLLEVIYDEAWELEEVGMAVPSRPSGLEPLHGIYESKEAFLCDVPRLIVEHNIHGIDIDPRAVQIAGLSLWLRAQKAWQVRDVKPTDRPRVRRSNIVCAEPMPGSPELLEDFIETLNPPLLGELVMTVFEKMQLAGEAGSLLKIEVEIRTAIDTARQEWLKQQGDLFARKDGSLEAFFNTAEQQLIDALRAYAEQADADSYQRRLFADDAARGFAFIDLCRKRYDAVVMNPPFGAASADSAKYIKSAHGKAAFDLFAAFLEGGLERLDLLGAIGAITTSSGFYRNQVEQWRSDFFLDGSIRACADLGGHVLDGATVRAATYVRDASPRSGHSVFVRCNEAPDKQLELLGSLDALRNARQGSNVFILDARLLREIPGSPLAYWLPEKFRRKVTNLKRFGDLGGEAQFGLSTKDDFRFLRLTWEAAPSEIGRTRKWSYTSKGGSYSPFYFDIHLLALHSNDFRELEQAILKKYPYLGDSASWVLHRENSYYSAGITFQRRTNKPFAPRVLPRDCLFTDNGPTAFWGKHSLLSFLGLFNSSVVKLLAAVGNGALEAEGGGGANSYEIGIINNIVVPELEDDVADKLEQLTLEVIRLKQAAAAAIPDTRTFLAPNICRTSLFDLPSSETSVDILHQQISNLVSPYYGFVPGEVEALIETVSPKSDEEFGMEADTESSGENEEEQAVDSGENFRNSVSYFLGTVLGRWDIRYATGERQPPELPDPFDALPVCPPGMLQSADGLPTEPKDVPAEYPLRISWSGILVGDENHPEDIVARVREAIEVIWKDRAEAIEQEACGILGVKTLRDYFSRPAAFFADHLKRYSKSRRQAPIYWPLSTKSGSYTLWLYYHRLTDQTLHTCLADFLDPKLRQVQSELDALTASGTGGTRAGELREFLDELHDLRDEIARVIKLPWKPNLNDGVLITASPLWPLFRLPKWQKDLKACWEQLVKGEYDWAHLAYTIWPQRVEQVCETDRSIAIAHNREDLCKVEPPKAGKARKRKKAADEDEGDGAPPDEMDFR